MSEFTLFSQNINEAAKRQVKVQTLWVTVEEVDWSEKTMVAKGVTDELEYFDISLGTGFTFIKPKVGCACLIGLVENNDAATFLIDAEEVEEILISYASNTVLMNSEGCAFNEGLNGGLIKIQNLINVINDLQNKHNQLASMLETLPVPVSGAVSGPPVPGSYTAVKIPKTTTVPDLENNKVKH